MVLVIIKTTYLILKNLILLLLVLCTLTVHNVQAQSIPVGSFQDQQMRIQSLLSDTVTVTTVNRPFSSDEYYTLLDKNGPGSGWWNRTVHPTEFEVYDGLHLGLQPFFIQNTINSRMPHGENNGAAWYGRGINTEWQAGFYLRSKYFSATFYPHFIYQQNVDFLMPRLFFESANPYISEIGGNIDNPIRFGSDPFTTFSLGNSSIRFHYKKFETGLSSEPLWWGGANRYPLLMSNNAPGVHHYFLGTRDQVSIFNFGKFHFKWVMGYPQESGYFLGPAEGEKRFLNAANFSFSPNFYENITIGVTRAYQLFETDGLTFSNIFVLFDPIRRASLVERSGPDEIRQERNQVASLYLHLFLPGANAELYAELFREDHSHDFRDLFVQPHHNSAYSFGLRKLSSVRYFDYIMTGLEFTSLTASQLRQVRPQDFYYSHSSINQGHTNRGQLLGAAIGPGSNSQLLSIDALKNNSTYGIFVQRMVDNDNLHFQIGSVSRSPFKEFGDYYRHRVDLNIGLSYQYSPGPVNLHSRLIWTKAYNYGRFDTGSYNGINIMNYEHNDRYNVQFQIGITVKL